MNIKLELSTNCGNIQFSLNYSIVVVSTMAVF